jgi:hypothetical protein
MPDPNLTNDINLTMSIRRRDGKKLTRPYVVRALLAMISMWETDDKALLDKIYEKNEPAQVVCGSGDDCAMFGAMFSDQFILNMSKDLRDAVNDAAGAAGATKSGSINPDGIENEEEEEYNIPQNIVDMLQNLINDNYKDEEQGDQEDE